MAMSTMEGHTSRALDFYAKDDIYFAIGKTTPWADELQPPVLTLHTRLQEIVGYKQVDTKYLLVPVTEGGTLQYSGQSWKTVSIPFLRELTSSASTGTNILELDDVTGIEEGDKLRVEKEFYSEVSDVNQGNSTITISDNLDQDYEIGDKVEFGAISEGSRWVYVGTTIVYDELPLIEFRQVGLVSGLIRVTGIPPAQNVLLPNEVEDYGILEVIQNRRKVTRSIDQRERLSLILEF